MLSSETRPDLTISLPKHSQSTPTPHFYEEPCSPASTTNSFISSVSWIAEKSASELGALLKNAYKSLREKEKDLVLVAEIGKSLLEHNQNLKADYDKLLQNVSTLNERREDMRLISNKKAYDKIIESLERKNEEIQCMLERTNQHSHLSQQNHERNQRKLETEIEILQSNLDIAAQKIQELEEARLLSQERANRQHESRIEQQHKEDLILLEELSAKIEDLYKENKYLQKSKKILEEKLTITLKDLERLRKEFEQFEITQEGYLTLQEAFQRQTDHVKELNDRLEEHRAVLSQYHEKGSLSNASSCNLMHELKGSVASLMKESDHSELSSSDSNYSSKLYDFASLTERHLASFYNAPADYAFDTILSTVGIDDRATLHEAEKLFCNHDEERLFGPERSESIYAELNLYPSDQILPITHLPKQELQPKGLIHRILFHIRYLFRSVFRWCRFALILVTAILINLWKGPDLILDK
ncbi:hypothetical protein G6F37_004503 [Rhizopus arrhizus]|nr:hypothetical protein G6F38_004668 [Rhizopus arrhizus]KAG1159872.1 hypothetical protein G6F37_004503 [Rhizopus arrhizus]